MEDEEKTPRVLKFPNLHEVKCLECECVGYLKTTTEGVVLEPRHVLPTLFSTTNENTREKFQSILPTVCKITEEQEEKGRSTFKDKVKTWIDKDFRLAQQ